MNHQIVGESTTHLAAEELAALRENLHEQRLFRQDQLRRLLDADGSGERKARQTAARREVRAKLADSARMVLADVEAALRRMDEGRYGSCHLCRRAVERERLAIVPQARYCARCQLVKEAVR